jgi:hypothetical protein
VSNKVARDDEGQMMILRTAILSAIALSFTASLALADEVLYCVENDAAGFKWDNQGHAAPTSFNPARFTIKITSETERVIARMTGDTAGKAVQYECQPVFFDDKDEIICRDPPGGLAPWSFYHNTTFVRAFLAGPPTGGTDKNIVISYGTCTKF